MRHLMFATAVVLASAATPPELRAETTWSVEGGLAVWQDRQSTAQLGTALTMASPGRIGGRFALAVLPQFFDVGARGALLDAAVVFPIALTPRLTLEPGFGPSVLGVWMGLGGVAVGGHVGLGLDYRIDPNLKVGVRYVHRQLYDWDEENRLSSITAAVSFPMRGGGD